MKRTKKEREKEQEFERLLAEAKRVEFSEGAKFMQALRGKKVYYEGKEICKWELWATGYRKAGLLINGYNPKIKIV